MRKLKLLIMACALMGAGQMLAQTDVTSTYLTNADFEGDYSSYSQPKSDRDIYQPASWTISYTNGESNDMTSLNSETTCWSNFSGRPQPTNGGSKAYWMRCRWGSSENITLSQETSANLPEGTYCISAEAYSDDNTGTVTISAAGLTKTVRTDGAWAKYTLVFTLASAQKVTVSLSYTNTAADDHAAAFDNVKILDLSSEPTGIVLKNDLSGTAATLSDFNVWYNDYTLEVEGTAGTEISVAADNITYTPEATGTVRFVKKDGIVYVFEGTAYKGAIHSSKADYTYSRTLSKDDPITNNYLANPSFETTGANISGSKYKFGDPWTTNYSGSDIRIDKGTKSGIHGTCVLVWRGSGSGKDWYFSQQISLPKYKGVKVFLQQIDGGNANAKFNVGVGNAAGDYSYVSTQFTLGSGKNGIYNAELGYNESMATGNVYFSFRNTSTNTASSGSDPVSQIDWIGLVGSNDFPITGVSSASYVYGTAYAPATAKSSYLAAKAEAEATIADATYDNVTGSERTDLQAAIDADVDDNDAAYNTATDNIQTAQEAFISALTHYQALIDAQAAVPDLAYASTAASAFKTAVATSASDADEKFAAMTTNIRAYYESHAMAEGNATTVDYSSAVSAANADTNTGWTNGIGTNTNEGYTDAAGNVSTKYLDGGWSATAGANIDMTRSVEIPAGKYLLTVTARGATDLTTYTLSIGGETVALPMHGSTGGVFGRGWDDVSVEFDADGTTQTLEVIANSTSYYQWISINRFRLVRLDATLATSDDYTALNSAISTARAKTLGFEDGEYAPYVNAAVLTKLVEAKAINQSANNEQSVVQGLTTYLNTAGNWTPNDGFVAPIHNGMFATVAEGQNYPEGWTRTNGWGQMKSDISGDYATAYYNQPGSLQYGDQGVYTMPLTANTAYALTFSYRSHENNSNNGMTVSVLNGSSEGLAATSFEGNGSTSDWKTVTKNFKTGAADNYVLKLANGGNTWMTNVSLVKATSESVEVTDAGFATYVSDVDLDFTSTTIKAYKVNVEEQGVATLTKVGQVPAKTPVLLYKKGGATEDIPVIASASSIGDNDLVRGTGDAVATYETVSTTNDYTNMILNNGDYGIGFYFANDKTVATNRAYLHIASEYAPDAEAGSRMVMVFADETTGVTDVRGKMEDVRGDFYNLNGQRVEKPAKGLYIQNGRKVVIK